MKKQFKVVVAGDDGKTRLQEDELELVTVEGVTPGGVFDAVALGASDVAIVHFAAGFEAGFHLTPDPTWMFVMSGRIAIGLSDDVWFELGPGDIVRVTDTSGEGHRSRVLGDDPVLMATAGFRQ
jgi:hypothetical protein